LCNSQKKRTVYEALSEGRWVTDINGALSLDVLVEYLGLWDLLADRELNPDVEDSHIWQFSDESGKDTICLSIRPKGSDTQMVRSYPNPSISYLDLFVLYSYPDMQSWISKI
jgi:hypothetical protein